MDAGRALLQARRRAGLSQRALARRAGVAQSTVARIERGAMDPRVSTLDALLRACDDELRTVRRIGVGVDRSLIAAELRRSPGERLDDAGAAGGFVAATRGTARRAAS